MSVDHEIELQIAFEFFTEPGKQMAKDTFLNMVQDC